MTKTKFKIKTYFGTVRFTYEADTLKEVLVEAVKQKANLYGANLYGADLRCADLRCADLRCANLYGANLSGVILPEDFKVARLDFGGWSVLVMKDKTIIGCQEHENTKWLKFTPKDVATFAEGASEWWEQHGASVKAVIKDVMAMDRLRAAGNGQVPAVAAAAWTILTADI